MGILKVLLLGFYFHFSIIMNEDQQVSLLFSINDKKSDDYLEALLLRTSDPLGELQTFSREDLISKTKSSVIHIVERILNQLGISSTQRTIYNDYILASASLPFWNQIFDWELKLHCFEAEKKICLPHLPTKEELMIPAIFQNYVDGILGIYSHYLAEVSPKQLFPKPPLGSFFNISDPIFNLNTNSSSLASFPGIVSPTFLNNYYQITNNTGSMTVSQTVYGSLDQYVSPRDLQLFQQLFGLPLEPLTNNIGDHVENGPCYEDIHHCVEANLDIQYIMSIAQHVSTTYHYWGFLVDPFVTWLFLLSNLHHPPSVLSISYGAEERYFTPAYLRAFNREAIKLALQGTSIIVASGDNGAISLMALNSTEQCSYGVIFPASSPYVTAIGATQGPEIRGTRTNQKGKGGDEEGGEEVVCQVGGTTKITSGGGFSNANPAFSYQIPLIEKYFQTVKQLASSSSGNINSILTPGYNRNGRGYPDISILGHNYLVILGGQAYLLDGTSASAPVFAGMISLINSARQQNALPSLGWLNPWLYTFHNNITHDITTGDNHCTIAIGFSWSSSSSSSSSSTSKNGGIGYYGHCCSEGFDAVKGWDPVSGLGAISYPDMYRIFTTYDLGKRSTLSFQTSSRFKHDNNLGIWLLIVVWASLGILLGSGCYACLRSWIIWRHRKLQGYARVHEQVLGAMKNDHHPC
jgi:subtilase family serine protease